MQGFLGCTEMAFFATNAELASIYEYDWPGLYVTENCKLFIS